MGVRRHIRLAVTGVAVFAILALLLPASASAGTLTSATFTAAGSGYTTTGAKNAQYDWGFTTATSGTVNRVSLGVPAGTNTFGPRYATEGKVSDFLSTPDTPSNSPTQNIDVRAHVTMTIGTPQPQRAPSSASTRAALTGPSYFEHLVRHREHCK